MRNFGQLLADQDVGGKLEIPAESFYRVIDSLQFGLGEGDIQELIKDYGPAMVSATRFKDDLNYFIQKPEYNVQLRSVLNELLAGRVVDQIEDLSPRSH